MPLTGAGVTAVEQVRRPQVPGQGLVLVPVSTQVPSFCYDGLWERGWRGRFRRFDYNDWFRGGGGGGATAAFGAPRVLSRYSAVILSSELEGT